MPSLVYTDRIPFSKRIGGYTNWLVGAGLLNDAYFATYPTITAMKNASAVTRQRPEHLPMLIKWFMALDKAKSLGIINETHGTTTAAQFVALTDAGPRFKQAFLD